MGRLSNIDLKLFVMTSQNLINLLLIALTVCTILTTSCERNDYNKDDHRKSYLVIGDSSSVQTQRNDVLIESSHPYDEQTATIDVDLDGVPDFMFTVVIDGSNGLGYATNHFIESLHENALFGSNIDIDTLYYSESYFVDSNNSPIWFNTIQRIDCNPSDSIVSINEFTKLHEYHEGDSIKTNSGWYSGRYVFIQRSYSGGYTDHRTVDTTFYISYHRHSR